MADKLISSGSDFEKIVGYSRAVVDGDWVFVAGTTGYDYATGEISDDVVDQTHQCFATISSALKEAGSGLEAVVRVHYYLTEATDFKKLGPVFGSYFSEIRPAATATVTGLVDPAMKIEIEVTARKQK
jgi:enamine deaminase RidA (YjgF/YER057c/UK114 family)